MAHVNRKEYWKVFVVLGVLTVLEVGAAKLEVLPQVPLVALLFALAVTKAAIVGLFYMHLKYETKILKLGVAIPMSIPAFYALILVAEGAWRRLPW